MTESTGATTGELGGDRMFCMEYAGFKATDTDGDIYPEFPRGPPASLSLSYREVFNSSLSPCEAPPGNSALGLFGTSC